jgi:hypothetical protein
MASSRFDASLSAFGDNLAAPGRKHFGGDCFDSSDGFRCARVPALRTSSHEFCAVRCCNHSP